MQAGLVCLMFLECLAGLGSRRRDLSEGYYSVMFVFRVSLLKMRVSWVIVLFVCMLVLPLRATDDCCLRMLFICDLHLVVSALSF